MQISLKFIQAINHAKSTIYIKFQLLVTFSFLVTGSSSLSVFPRGVLYVRACKRVSVIDLVGRNRRIRIDRQKRGDTRIGDQVDRERDKNRVRVRCRQTEIEKEYRDTEMRQ